MITGADFAWFPLSNPGIVSIPLGFLFGVLGTYLGRDKSSEDRYNELSVRALTGAGAEGPAKH
jgi:cation/acetate symporter